MRPSPLLAPPRPGFVTDAVALALLLVALLSPWDNGHRGVDHVAVVLLTTVSVLSLAVGWLARVSPTPPRWTAVTVPRLRLLAGAAYTVLVLVQILLDGLSRLSVAGGWRGTGLAVGLGLAGAVLAARPRSEEVEGPDEEGVARLWRGIAVGLAAACVVLLLIGTVMDARITVAVLVFPGGMSLGVATLLFMASALQVLVLLVPLLALMTSEGARWRPSAVAVGASLCVLALWRQTEPETAMSTVHSPVIALCFVPAAVAAGLVALRTGGAGAGGWSGSAVAPLCAVVVASAGVHALQVLSQMVFSATLRGPDGLVPIALLLLLGAAALRARARLLGRDDVVLRERVVLSSTVVILGVAALVADTSTTRFGTSTNSIVGDVGLPLVLLVLLILPRSPHPGSEHRLVRSPAEPSSTT